MNRYATFLGLSLFVFGITGCGKKDDASVEHANKVTKRDDTVSEILLAFNNKDYETSERLIFSFLSEFPDDAATPSMQLRLADIQYELQKYPQAYGAYRDFSERYPAHEKAEYAVYKAAHAKFVQANHVNCDPTPTEETIRHCKSYLARNDFNEFRTQMRNLERTCQQRLIDREFYIANSYINQHKLTSAHNRLDLIKSSFDLSAYNAEDKALFYQAKLAKKENNMEELSDIIENLHADHPTSHFTAMADRLEKSWF